MVLKAQTPAAHNQMLGQRIRHPPSTKFDNDFDTPAAKRLKRFDSTDSSLSRNVSGGDEVASPSSRQRLVAREIADSEAESDEDDDLPAGATHKTELESALPPIKTDKEAIAEYEATRATESTDPSDLHGRLGQRKWVQGKSSIYVDAFNLALETVLEDESHLFDEAEMAVFEQWRSLSYEAQYLYVRLFLRKTAAWHRINRLGYYSDIADLAGAVKELRTPRSLPASTGDIQVNPGEIECWESTTLEGPFTFADGSDGQITTFEEASTLLKLDELKTIAKEAKVHGKNKRELLIALRRTSQKQGGLGWASIKRSDTEDSVKSDGSIFEQNESVDLANIDGAGINRDSHFVRKILANTGSCVRLSSAPLKLFERVHLVFYRSTAWTEKSLTTIILARTSRRNFPECIVSRSTNIFTSRGTLLEFEASIRTQFRIDSILEFNGTVTRDGLQKVKDIFEDVYPRWRVLVDEEQQKEDRVYESGEGAYLRRFSPAWVYTRIVHKATAVLGRFKEHKREHQILTELLNQRLFHTARRGAWYQRKALLEEHYMWNLEPSRGRNDEAQKKHWKRVSLSTCEEGLEDNECHLIYQYDLQKRVMKLEKTLKVVKREQHDFGYVRLAKPVERSVEGIRIEKDSARGRSGGRRGSDQSLPRRGKTVWLDEREGGGECSVESMCLSWYREQGWKGYHSEGGIVRTLFGYLFYDVLFTYIPNVFQTPYQTCPLDLHTDAFYPSRAFEINRRLAEIANGEAEKLLKEVYDRESEKQTCIVGIDWAFEVENLLEIIQCFRGEALATMCKVMVQEYQQRGGGIPDLFLWRPDRKEVMFSEVKSENDRLSDTQRLWIHVLTGAGIKVELCNAVAREVRVEG
ncbi:VRR-NUC domain [Lasallia pustulata]|uniref:Fanconi-associated nuclease n=1 Tax=Lasallia pustulata TaxID=136370 RepID=A0A1W5CU35_9LECA|nr:VRR-NUC domain [Lasallia pustulata]